MSDDNDKLVKSLVAHLTEHAKSITELEEAAEAALLLGGWEACWDVIGVPRVMPVNVGTPGSGREFRISLMSKDRLEVLARIESRHAARLRKAAYEAAERSRRRVSSCGHGTPACDECVEYDTLLANSS
jgi:hypothetical protein